MYFQSKYLIKYQKKIKKLLIKIIPLFYINFSSVLQENKKLFLQDKSSEVFIIRRFFSFSFFKRCNEINFEFLYPLRIITGKDVRSTNPLFTQSNIFLSQSNKLKIILFLYSTKMSLSNAWFFQVTFNISSFFISIKNFQL